MVIALLAVSAAAASNPNVAVGRWATQTRHGIVQIDRCGSSICGRIVTSDGLRENPALTDQHNRSPALRSRKLLGLQILGGFKASGNQWTGGTIYNAEDGGTYKATVTPIDANHLKVRGCVIWPLCKTQVWTRVR